MKIKPRTIRLAYCQELKASIEFFAVVMFDESKRDTDITKQNKTMNKGFVNSTSPFHRFYRYFNKAKVNWILNEFYPRFEH